MPRQVVRQRQEERRQVALEQAKLGIEQSQAEQGASSLQEQALAGAARIGGGA
ncbi:MAG: hypothetical protein IH823_03715 [Candidatus Dadabacteria bacterium]|nr:hypothetical protein [Candidatus Dadabacteria bacterium]